jgi:type VI secretion system secreted protein Hcp
VGIDCFLKIEGIKGEAQDKDHKGEIDVMSWNWGASNSLTTGANLGHAHDLRFTKRSDKSTPQLYAKAISPGAKGVKATLVCRKSGEKPLDFMTITMEETFIASVSTGHSDHGPPTEEITLNFGKVTVEYKEQTDKGGVGDVNSASFDLRDRQKKQ